MGGAGHIGSRSRGRKAPISLLADKAGECSLESQTEYTSVLDVVAFAMLLG